MAEITRQQGTDGALELETDDPRLPALKVSGSPARIFTRRCARTDGTSASMPVIEINGVRLYLHPVYGPILSTLDLYP